MRSERTVDWIIAQPCFIRSSEQDQITETLIHISRPRLVYDPGTDIVGNFESGCWLQIDGFLDLAGPLIGFSTLHALCMALSVAENMLGDLVRDGGRLEDSSGNAFQMGGEERIVSAAPDDLLAQHMVVAVAPAGVHKTGRFALGNVEGAKDTWRCSIASDGVDSLSVAVEAPTPLGCVFGAVAELSARVSERIKSGWMFLEPHDGSAIVPIELLAPLRAHSNRP